MTCKCPEKADDRAFDLELFNKLSVDRELNMLELKNEVNELLKEAGKPPKYQVDHETILKDYEQLLLVEKVLCGEKKDFQGGLASKDELKKSLKAALNILDDFSRQKDELNQTLTQKNFLLQEIHHRVKNNLQSIISMIRLEYGEMDEDCEPLQELEVRIRIMGILHELLYQSDNYSEIEISEYIKRIVTYLVQTRRVAIGQIETVFEIQRAILNIDLAIPCGLLINELVTNCMKHAFPDGRKGKITLKFIMSDSKRELIVADNGVGIPPEIDFYRNGTLGFVLVNSWVRQLRGQIELDTKNGSEFRILF